MKTTVLMDKLCIKPYFSTKKPVSVEKSFNMLPLSTKIAVSVDKGGSMCRYKRNCRPENHFCGRQSVRAIFMFN